MRFILFALSILTVSAASFDAQAQPCPGSLSAIESGDAGFSLGPLSSVINNAVLNSSTRQWLFVGPWGIESEASWHRTAANETCAAGYSSNDCASRRILNSAVLADYVQKDGNPGVWGTWRYWSDLAIGDMDYISTCNKFADASIFGYVNMSRYGIFGQSVIARTGTIMHEAQHISSGRWHCGDVNGGGPCYCAQQASCDVTWAYNGANRAKVEFIVQTLQTPGLGIPEFARLEAIEEANQILNEAFSRHPGFILDAPTASSSPVFEHWDLSASAVQLSTFKHSLKGTPALWSLEISMGMAFSIPSVTQLNSWSENLLFRDFKNSQHVDGGPSYSSLAAGVPSAPEVNVFKLPGSSFYGPNALVSLDLRAVNNDVVAARAGFRAIRDGVAIAPTTFVTSPSGASGPWDLSVSAPSGLFIRGLGLGVAPTTGALVASAEFALGPEFEKLSGGAGGTARVLKCSANKVPIAIHVKSVHVPHYGSNMVGYFGIVCVDREQWMLSGLYEDMELVRGSFTDDATGVVYPAGTYEYFGAAYPPGISTAWCPQRSMIRGMKVMAGVEVDKISELYCSTPLNGVVQINAGGGGGQANVQDCWSGPGPSLMPGSYSYAPVFFTRSAARLDALAVGCHSSVEYIAAFEGQVDDFAFLETGGGAGRWNIRSGTTPSSGTGPSGAIEGSFYAFVEATGAPPGTEARIQSDIIDLRYNVAPNISLTWKYHMYGIAMGTIRVEAVRDTGAITVLSTISGNKGDAWHSHPAVSLNQFRGEKIRIRFVGVVGSSFTSDMAVDDIQLRSH